MLNGRWPHGLSMWNWVRDTKVKRDGLVSIVSYSRPSLMIIASRTQFHVERPWGKRLFSIVSRFQPGEGPRRGLLRDCTTSPINRFVALDNILIFHVSSPHDVWHSSVESVPSVASCNNISLAVIIQPNISSAGLNWTMLTHRQIMSPRKILSLKRFKIIRHIVCCV